MEIEINNEFKTETEENKIQNEKLKDPLHIEDINNFHVKQ